MRGVAIQQVRELQDMYYSPITKFSARVVHKINAGLY